MTNAHASSMSVLPLADILVQNWWLFLLRGIAAIIFGAVSLAWPGITLLMLILLFGVFVIADGVFALLAGVIGKATAARRWWLVIVGLLGVVAGGLALALSRITLPDITLPGITALVLLYFIAGWAVAMGVFQIIGAVQLRKEIDNEWFLMLSGVLSILFGLAIFAMPGAAASNLVWLIAFYAILHGILLVGFAFRLRRCRTQTS